ncbi:zinc finger DNA-binding protein [Colletotrichum tofieldiae]|nr:zinc finger DNA-binding protein [Colletotrichum tofieldiae]GKT72477.1 zinc finger DNA-binding protein [Colletotrichum tofieldiae]
MQPKASDVSDQPMMPSVNNKRGLSHSIHNPQAEHNWQLRPKHFIVREGGAIVPLIPVDLLPTYLSIHGISRTMSIEDTTGMSNLGMFLRPEGCFQLWPPPPTNDEPRSAVDFSQNDMSGIDDPASLQRIERPHDSTQEPTLKAPVARRVSESMTRDSRLSPPCSTMPTEKPQSQLPASRVLDWAEDTESVSTDDFSATDEDHSTSSTSNMASNSKGKPQSQQSPTTGKEKSVAKIANGMLELGRSQCATRQALPSRTNTQSNGDGTTRSPKTGKQKIPRPAGSLCRHWCQTGQCSWGTECRYTHQMPVTLEGLADVGLTELPGWWRRAAGLPVKGTIDVRIFAAAGAASAGAGGGKKSSSSALAPGTMLMVPVHPSKKARSKVEKEERKMAEEVHMIRLGAERAQTTAASPLVIGPEGRKKLGLGQVQAPIRPGNVQPQYEEVEKLVDI